MTSTTKTPRFPAPFLVVTEIMLEPLPSNRTSDNEVTRLFPFPCCTALSVRTPVAFVSVSNAVPVLSASTLWLKESVLGLSVATHCGIGVGTTLGVGVGLGIGGIWRRVGVALGFHSRFRFRFRAVLVWHSDREWHSDGRVGLHLIGVALVNLMVEVLDRLSCRR